MRCDQVQETIIDLIYDPSSTLPENMEIREHLRTCPACRKELEELAQTRKYLQHWEDEPPARHFTWPRKSPDPARLLGRRSLRYAAIAAMVLISVLALANTRITWNKDGFSFSTHLFPGRTAEGDYYTKAELRSLLKRALDESESQTNETVYLMMQEAMNTIEQDRWMDLNLIRSRTSMRRQNN